MFFLTFIHQGVNKEEPLCLTVVKWAREFAGMQKGWSALPSFFRETVPKILRAQGSVIRSRELLIYREAPHFGGWNTHQRIRTRALPLRDCLGPS